MTISWSPSGSRVDVVNVHCKERTLERKVFAREPMKGEPCDRCMPVYYQMIVESGFV